LFVVAIERAPVTDVRFGVDPPDFGLDGARTLLEG
jgi:hypothetical protein